MKATATVLPPINQCQMMTLTDFLKKIGNLKRADAPMAGACPIQSSYFSVTQSNGLALCPNLHRAFDVGLISLTDDYQVLVKAGLKESKTDYSLKKLEGEDSAAEGGKVSAGGGSG